MAAPGPVPGNASDADARHEARERLTRRLVGLVVLTVAFSAASTLLPPRGSADRTAPAPDENATGVEVQTVPLVGVSRNSRGRTESDPLPVADASDEASRATSATVAPTARVETSGPVAAAANAEFAQDAPPTAGEAPTLKDVAAAEFDERRLAPPTAAAGGAVRPAVSVPVPSRSPEVPPATRPVVVGGTEAWVVQVGVFSTRAKADGVAAQIRAAGLPAPRIEAVQLASGATRYRVRIPTGADGVAARAARDRVNGLPGAFGAEVRSIPTEG